MSKITTSEQQRWGLQPRQHDKPQPAEPAEPAEPSALPGEQLELPLIEAKPPDPPTPHPWDRPGVDAALERRLKGPIYVLFSREIDGHAQRISLLSANHGGSAEAIEDLLKQKFRIVPEAERAGKGRVNPFARCQPIQNRNRRS